MPFIDTLFAPNRQFNPATIRIRPSDIITLPPRLSPIALRFRPPQVWSPAGGWWPTPVAWKRNTAVCAFGICVVSSLIFKVSAEKERRPIPPYKHIPSQRWCKHAKEDDPSLP